MTEQALYMGKTDSVDNLARSLIVASVVQSGQQPITLPLTPAGARHLGRFLEASMSRLRHWDEAKAAWGRAEATLGEARVVRANAKDALDRAVQLNRASILWCGCALVALLANLALAVLA